MIQRLYKLSKEIKSGKILVIYGPRRSGKTTLIKQFLNETKLKFKLDSGDSIRVQQIIGSQDFAQIKEYVSGYELLVIDEAQQIKGIGMGLKIISDEIPNLKVIVTGSSSFEIGQQIGEPLTGRKRTLTLYPVAQTELLSVYNKFELREKLNEFLVYGSYPEVCMAKTQRAKSEILIELADSYLMKDILSFEKIRNPKTLLDLLRLLAFQLGNQVSHNELSNKLGVNVRTISRYLELLEKTFVILKLGAYSGNLRDEVTSKNKYFFYDNGVRNALINNFNRLDLRNDTGPLWENFMFTERLKKQKYKGKHINFYYWRSYTQKEIDLIEEYDGKLHTYEFKYSPVKIHQPIEFAEKYSDSSYKIVHIENYLDFIL